MNILNIFEESKVLDSLKKRQLLKQYIKAKRYILEGYLKQTNFKLKQPTERGIYSFRINKQFRALCVFRKNELIVFEIDNHQN